MNKKINIRISYKDGEGYITTTYINVVDFHRTDVVATIVVAANQTVIIPISRIFSITITEKE